MSRRLARELAFIVLFQMDIGRHAWLEVLKRTLAENDDLPKRSQTFLEELVRQTTENLEEIDAAISRYAQDWKLERMASTDRNVLRIAAAELLHGKDVPPSVAINEAVELAKRYGDEESGKFVNGILGSLARETGRLDTENKLDEKIED
jgi:N utilization substance protein B